MSVESVVMFLLSFLILVILCLFSFFRGYYGSRFINFLDLRKELALEFLNFFISILLIFNKYYVLLLALLSTLLIYFPKVETKIIDLRRCKHCFGSVLHLYYVVLSLPHNSKYLLIFLVTSSLAYGLFSILS